MYSIDVKQDWCPSSKVVCNDGKNCVASLEQCEKHLHTPSRCSSGKVECYSGQCVDKQKICNGVIDCHDDSYEFNCDRRKSLRVYCFVC